MEALRGKLNLVVDEHGDERPLLTLILRKTGNAEEDSKRLYGLMYDILDFAEGALSLEREALALSFAKPTDIEDCLASGIMLGTDVPVSPAATNKILEALRDGALNWDVPLTIPPGLFDWSKKVQ